MSTSFIIGNAASTDSNVSAVLARSYAGVGTWFAATFWGYESQTINRVMFYNAAITGGGNYTMRVGIGTVDRATGLPQTVGGLGVTLAFSSSIDVTSFTANSFSIHAISDFTLDPLSKYWVGMEAISSTGAFTHATNLLGLNNNTDRNSTRPIITRSAGTISALHYDGNRNLPINWGYDSGTASTVWYNPFVGGATYNVLGSISLTNMLGFTFTHSTDFESIYVNSIKIYARVLESTFPTGTGTTFHCILYDSDGTTAMIGSTTPTYTANVTQVSHVVLPLGAWLDRNKLYHIAFAIVNGGTAANNQIVWQAMPYSWQGGLGFTSIYFTKASGASAPTYTSDRIVPFFMNVTKTRGHLQNSEGNINVF